MRRSLFRRALGLLLLTLLCATASAEATMKVLVFVQRPDFDGTTFSFSLMLRLPGQPDLGTRRTVAATAVTDPATIAASIKTLVVTFLASQFGMTLTVDEIVLIGAPQ